MQATGKPFLVIINSRDPYGKAAKALQESIQQEFGVEAAIADCQALTAEDIGQLLQDLLYAFPMQQLQVRLPRWMDALEAEQPVKSAICTALLECAQQIHSLGQAENALQ